MSKVLPHLSYLSAIIDVEKVFMNFQHSTSLAIVHLDFLFVGDYYLEIVGVNISPERIEILVLGLSFEISLLACFSILIKAVSVKLNKSLAINPEHLIA